MSEASYKVEKDIPVPPIIRRPHSEWKKYPLWEMEVGDSFFVPFKERSYVTVQSSVFQFARRNRMKFRTAPWFEDGEPGIRVWRVK